MDALGIFRLVASEFSNMPDDDEVDPDTGKVIQYGVTSFLSLFSDQISERRFGSSYQKALAYLTAHKLKMMGYGENEGLGSIGLSLRVNSVSEGEASVSFGTNQASNLNADAEFALTVYGLEYLTLRRSCIIPIINAGEAPLV